MKIIKLWNWDNFVVFLLSFACFFLLPLVDVARGALVVLFILLLFGKEKKNTIHSYLSTSYKWIFWSCLSLYFIYVIGILYSPDKLSGISELETKITLLLMPILFLLIPKRLFSEENQKKYLFSYILSCLVFAAWTLIKAYLRFSGNPKISTDTFFKSDLALHVHTTYASLFFVMGIAFSFYLLKKISLKKWQKYSLIGVICIFFGYTILLSSRGGLLALIITSILIIISFIKTKKSIIYGFLSFILFTTLLLFLGERVNYLHRRINDTKSAIENFHEDAPKQDARISLWKNTIPVIKERFWFGIGTGGKDIAMDAIKIEENPDLNNPHNQYLQTAIEVGFLGVLFLCFMFSTALWVGVKKRSYLLTIFILIFSVNCLFESMLERVQGNTFFMFILFMIVSIIFRNKKEQDTIRVE
ncbi:O-antigen ligase family protein [Bacteroidales bacterium OttesenSCG-928-C19]|nr:O-antigen ligase family protein [Bacteroidales bacterium OttesenSCG-928-C19]